MNLVVSGQAVAQETGGSLISRWGKGRGHGPRTVGEVVAGRVHLHSRSGEQLRCSEGSRSCGKVIPLPGPVILGLPRPRSLGRFLGRGARWERGEGRAGRSCERRWPRGGSISPPAVSEPPGPAGRGDSGSSEMLKWLGTGGAKGWRADPGAG